MTNSMDIIEAVKSDSGFRPFFKDMATWQPWFVFLKVLTGLKDFTDAEMTLFRECTGLDELPSVPIKEAWICAGRRSGKSSVVSLLAVFYTFWGNWQAYLSRGEVAEIFVIGVNKAQCRIIMNYIEAILNMHPSFKRMIKKVTQETIVLKNKVTILVKPASWRSPRGATLGLLLLEEIAFFRFETEMANPDLEVYTACLPGMTTIPNSLCIGISTPFARQGLLYDKVSKHWGRPGNVLAWRAPSWRMNLTLTEEGLREQYEEVLGEERFGAEYANRFREDIESYMPIDIIDRAIVKGRAMLKEEYGLSYVAFADASEGLRKTGDSMTFCIGHRADEKLVIDVLLEFRPPFDPKDVLSRIAGVAKPYGVTMITQDRHAVGWIASDLREFGITVETSEWTKSQLYEFFAVEMNKDRVELLDNERLRNQIAGLQRFLTGSGVRIDHYRSGHDDLINSVAGVVSILSQGKGDEGGFFVSDRPFYGPGSSGEYDNVRRSVGGDFEGNPFADWMAHSHIGTKDDDDE